MNKKINILHICSYFSGISAVYEHTFEELDKLGHMQKIYVPNRLIKREKKVSFTDSGSEIYFRQIWNNFSRIAYFNKIKKATTDAINILPLEDCNVMHAHSWFTDGGIAYRLFENYNIPYVITVRSTDVDTFAKYFYHVHSYGKRILLNAKKIIFVSKAYERRVLDFPFLADNREEILKKSVVLPNGIDDFWIKAVQDKKQIIDKKHIKILYIGNFLRRKNVKALIHAVDHINSLSHKISLEIVGGGREYSNKLLQLIENNENINFLGKIKNKERLAQVIRQNDIFVMPSYNETFGLVYIEALSQGIPVIYSKNEGIDGFHAHNIGERVDHKNVEEIAQAILKVYDDYEQYDFVPKEIIKHHQWSEIAQKLSAIYYTCLEK